MVAHLDSVASLDVDVAGLVLVSGGHDSSVRFWDMAAAKACIQEFTSHRRKADEAVCTVRYHPGGLPWMASGGADSLVKIYNRV